MRKYKSKIGLFLSGMVALTTIGLCYASWYDRTWVGFTIALPLSSFFATILFRTYYQVRSKVLHIRSGFWSCEVDINSIRKISKTSDLSSAPALSFDRLEILYNKFDTVVISPRDKEKAELIQEILAQNPSIEVKL